MRYRFLSACCLVFLVFGCVVFHIDAGAIFVLSGRVVDQHGNGIEGVSVSFKDLGFDEWASEFGSDILVSQTDQEGLVADDFFYFWGFSSSRPFPGDFELVFSKPPFAARRIRFNFRTLEFRDSKYVVEFDVEMSVSLANNGLGHNQ